MQRKQLIRPKANLTVRQSRRTLITLMRGTIRRTRSPSATLDIRFTGIKVRPSSHNWIRTPTRLWHLSEVVFSVEAQPCGRRSGSSNRSSLRTRKWIAIRLFWRQAAMWITTFLRQLIQVPKTARTATLWNFSSFSKITLVVAHKTIVIRRCSRSTVTRSWLGDRLPRKHQGPASSVRITSAT